MTLEQLRVFISVAENQHVTKAAKALNMTQSAASVAVSTLEERYKVRLFDRVGRGVVLTQEGRAFLKEARAVVSQAASARQTLHDLAGLKRGSMTIAASQTIANYWLPMRLQRFRAEHPEINLQIAIGNTQQVTELVEDGDADLGFIEGVIDRPALVIQEIEGDSLVVIVGANHPWAQRDEVSPQCFMETSWILREKGSGTRSMFETALKGFGLNPQDLTIAFEVPSNEAIRALVAAGNSAAAISNLVVAQHLSDDICRIKCDLPGRPFFVLRHKERHANQTETAVRSIFGITPTS